MEYSKEYLATLEKANDDYLQTKRELIKQIQEWMLPHMTVLELDYLIRKHIDFQNYNQGVEEEVEKQIDKEVEEERKYK
tara:strand:+ start:576 stop:812 length:237 start_codon:yes stop_codon:yes gene_type:complete